jgi:glycosyltransferase involved in cell wall biosynthesis
MSDRRSAEREGWSTCSGRAVSSRSLTFIVPGRIETRTGGYEYDRRMIGGLRDRGWTVDVRELDDSFPEPTPSALEDAERALSAVAGGTIVAIDGLACSAMPAVVERHRSRLSIVPIVHALIAAEIGIDRATAARRAEGERRALGCSALIVLAGRVLIEQLAHYRIERSRVAVVTPGVDRAPLARGSAASAGLHLVTVATLNPGKGHKILFQALSRLTDRSWRLTCAGSAERHPETTARLRSLLTALRLDNRVTLAGELNGSDIAALYDSADAAVLPTLSETFSMAAAEALARGLPVVSTVTGAIPDLVGQGDDAAGVLAPPGDVDALSDALANVIDDACFRARLAENARRVRERLPTWDDAVRTMDSVMVSLSNHQRRAHPSASSG